MLRSSFALILALFLVGNPANASEKQPKEWTFLIFLNGNNNLDSYGHKDMNEMEQVGSTDNVNVVVQWASLKNKDVRRVYVEKDEDTSKVNSTVLANMGRVDMGDYKNLIEFVRWGVENYPAKHYFINVWDHGAGWHKKKKENGGPGDMSPVDISWDDISGNHMTTAQLGIAIQESAKIIGHKVDIYGSDACLMAMPEIAAEMKDSVDYFIGSEETEPADGWPYDQLMARWTARPRVTPKGVSEILIEEYIKFYEKRNQAVTLSAFDMSHFDAYSESVKNLSAAIQKLGPSQLKKVLNAAKDSTSFAYSDYVDFVDFLNKMKGSRIRGMNSEIDAAIAATKKFVAVESQHDFPDTHGLALWIPTSTWTLKSYADRYSQLVFNGMTNWLDALKTILK